MPELSPAAIYQSLDERRLVVFIGKHIAADEHYAFNRRLADFILRYGVATVVLTATDPDLLQLFAEWGAEVNHIVAGADLAAMQPDRPSLFSLSGPDGAGAQPQVQALLRQRLSDQTLICYGVDPNEVGSIPSAVGWPDFDRAQLLALVWKEGGDAPGPNLPANVAIFGRDPFELLYAQVSHVQMDDGEDRGGREDIDPGPPPPPSPPGNDSTGLRAESLRIDAAVPERVEVNHAFVLAVALRQINSPRLAEADLSVVTSGEAQVVFEGEGPIRLRLQISAPDCQIDGDDKIGFRLWPGKDSQTFYFNLSPLRAGSISIIIRLFQEEEFLGASRLATQASGEPAGQVQVLVQSLPLSAPSDAAKRQIEEKGAQLQLAKLLLEKLTANLVQLLPGAQRAEVETQITLQESLVKGLERQIDALMQPG